MISRFSSPVVRSILCLGLTCCLASCSPYSGPDKTFAGALLGAGWGAGAGAVIGNQVNSTGPGAAIGAGFGAASGMLTGIGLDLAEGTELEQQREMDALKIQVAANQRSLAMLQDALDARTQKLSMTSTSSQVFFDANRASLRSGSVEQLERLANLTKQNPYIGMIELHGHSDSSSDKDQENKLSEARARTVATFLASHGISLDQINLVAHGAERPLASTESEAGRQLNRRVEIVFRR